MRTDDEEREHEEQGDFAECQYLTGRMKRRPSGVTRSVKSKVKSKVRIKTTVEKVVNGGNGGNTLIPKACNKGRFTVCK